LDTGQPQECTLRIVRHGDTAFFAHLKVTAARDENGAPVCRVVLIDVSERKRTEEELREALVSAKAAALAKSEFLAMISHELRTPLNGVIGVAQILADFPLTGKQTEFVRMIGDSGNRLLAIVNDLLDFSSMEKNALVIEDKSLSVAGLVKAADLAIRAFAVEKGLELRCELAAGVPEEITGDERRIRQILLNLLGNAVKFTSRGSVVLRVARSGQGGGEPCLPAGKIPSVRGAGSPHRQSVSEQEGRAFPPEQTVDSKASEFLDFSVEDTGIGISPGPMDLLFKPFVQVDAKMSRAFAGTGLGLVISRQLAEIMGGTITVASTPGKGSTFTFHFPLKSAPVRAGEMASVPSPIPDPERTKSALVEHGPPVQTGESPTPSGGGLTLIVEDDPVCIKLCGLLLDSLGCRTEFAANGAEAVRAFAPGKFSCILMDLSMPVMDGLEATREIRRLEAGSGLRVPIVALTANVMPDDRERCLASGMDDFLSKPFTKAQLAAKLSHPGGVLGK